MNNKYIKINICVALSLYSIIHAMENNLKITDKRYIKQYCMNWTERKIISLEPLSGGRSGSRLYDISFDEGDSCIVRLLVSSFAREKLWQETEIAVMKSGYKAGISPKVFAAHSKDENHEVGYVVMQKINAIAPQNIPWKDALTYTSLGELLKKMHNQPSKVSVDENIIYQRMNCIANRLKTKWQETGVTGLSKQCNKVADFFEKSQKVLVPHGRSRLVHGDLLIGNILHDGARFWAIDWEHSRANADPLFDVAMVHDCFVPNEYYATFMQGYCGQNELESEKQERFNIIRILTSCFIGMAYASSLPERFTSQFYKHKELNTDVTHVLQNMIHAGFKAETRDEMLTFGTLLFIQGYKRLKSEHESLLKIIDKNNKA